MLYDRLARWYDLLTALGEGPLRDAGLDLLCAAPGEAVVEIGVGTGQCLPLLTRAVGPMGVVVGVDLSAGMLGVASRRLKRLGLRRRVTLVRADARCLPLPAHSADAVFASFTLELFGDGDARLVLAECRRVLRPDGRLGVVALEARGRLTPTRWAYDLAHRHWPAAVDCHPIAVRRLLAAEGFEIAARREASAWGLPVAVVVARPARGVTAPAD